MVKFRSKVQVFYFFKKKTRHLLRDIGLGCLHGVGWRLAVRLLDDLELEDVYAEVLLLLRIDTPKDVECSCGVVRDDVPRLLILEHFDECRIGADVRHFDDAKMGTAFKTNMFTFLDALDVAVADTDLERFRACQNSAEVLPSDAHHSHNCVLHYQSPLLGYNATLVCFGHHRLDAPTVMLERFNFHTRGNGMSVEFVPVFPKMVGQLRHESGERLHIFGDERHKFDGVAFFRGCRRHSENRAVRGLRHPDEFVFLIGVAGILSVVALEESVYPTVINAVEVGRKTADDQMPHLLFIRLFKRTDRDGAFLWVDAVVLHDFVEHYLINVRSIVPTGDTCTDIAVRQEETQGEGVLRRDSAVDLSDPILLRILVEFAEKHTTDTFASGFLTDNQRADFDRALVLGHEVEDTDDIVIFVIHRHIHQLFSREVTLLILIAFRGSFDDALCVCPMVTAVERIKMMVHHLRHDRQVIKANPPNFYHLKELLLLICYKR
jgi:hypothetical protein